MAVSSNLKGSILDELQPLQIVLGGYRGSDGGSKGEDLPH